MPGCIVKKAKWLTWQSGWTTGGGGLRIVFKRAQSTSIKREHGPRADSESSGESGDSGISGVSTQTIASEFLSSRASDLGTPT